MTNSACAISRFCDRPPPLSATRRSLGVECVDAAQRLPTRARARREQLGLSAVGKRCSPAGGRQLEPVRRGSRASARRLARRSAAPNSTSALAYSRRDCDCSRTATASCSNAIPSGPPSTSPATTRDRPSDRGAPSRDSSSSCWAYRRASSSSPRATRASAAFERQAKTAGLRTPSSVEEPADAEELAQSTSCRPRLAVAGPERRRTSPRRRTRCGRRVPSSRWVLARVDAPCSISASERIATA